MREWSMASRKDSLYCWITCSSFYFMASPNFLTNWRHLLWFFSWFTFPLHFQHLVQIHHSTTLDNFKASNKPFGATLRSPLLFDRVWLQGMVRVVMEVGENTRVLFLSAMSFVCFKRRNNQIFSYSSNWFWFSATLINRGASLSVVG